MIYLNLIKEGMRKMVITFCNHLNVLKKVLKKSLKRPNLIKNKITRKKKKNYYNILKEYIAEDSDNGQVFLNDSYQNAKSKGTVIIICFINESSKNWTWLYLHFQKSNLLTLLQRLQSLCHFFVIGWKYILFPDMLCWHHHKSMINFTKSLTLSDILKLIHLPTDIL